MNQFKFEEYRTTKELEQELFQTAMELQEAQGTIIEQDYSILELKAKMFEYKTQVMHLNKCLAKKNRKLKSLNKEVAEKKRTSMVKFAGAERPSGLEPIGFNGISGRKIGGGV